MTLLIAERDYFVFTIIRKFLNVPSLTDQQTLANTQQNGAKNILHVTGLQRVHKYWQTWGSNRLAQNHKRVLFIKPKSRLNFELHHKRIFYKCVSDKVGHLCMASNLCYPRNVTRTITVPTPQYWIIRFLIILNIYWNCCKCSHTYGTPCGQTLKRIFWVFEARTLTLICVTLR